ALASPTSRDRIAARADEKRVEVEPLNRTGGARAVRGQASRAVVHRETRLVIREIVDALSERGIPLRRRAGGALLRDDVDHAVGGFGAVKRRCTRALQHLDRLD